MGCWGDVMRGGGEKDKDSGKNISISSPSHSPVSAIKHEALCVCGWGG